MCSQKSRFIFHQCKLYQQHSYLSSTNTVSSFPRSGALFWGEENHVLLVPFITSFLPRTFTSDSPFPLHKTRRAAPTRHACWGLPRLACLPTGAHCPAVSTSSVWLRWAAVVMRAFVVPVHAACHITRPHPASHHTLT